MDPKKIGIVIKDLRVKIGMTQKQLAEKVDCSRSYIGDIERGAYNASLDTLSNIANALGVNLSYLILKAEKSEDVSQDIEYLRLENEYQDGVTLIREANEKLNKKQKKDLAEFIEFFIKKELEKTNNKEGD